MTEEEKEAIKILKQEPDFSLSYYKRERAIDIVLNLIEKQQKEIKELKWKENEQKELLKYKTDRIDQQQKEIEELEKKCNNKYYHTIKCRELEKEINNGWKDKINKLKEEVETEQISNPYDFSYLLNKMVEE